VLTDKPFMIALHAGVMFLQYRQSAFFRELAEHPNCMISILQAAVLAVYHGYQCLDSFSWKDALRPSAVAMDPASDCKRDEKKTGSHNPNENRYDPCSQSLPMSPNR
jgi:hypothetical protein